MSQTQYDATDTLCSAPRTARSRPNLRVVSRFSFISKSREDGPFLATTACEYAFNKPYYPTVLEIVP
jgi:hypothetical protein